MCGHISLHYITTIDDIYLNYILYYTGNSIHQLDEMTSFIQLITTSKNTKMLRLLQLAPLSPDFLRKKLSVLHLLAKLFFG